MAKEPKPGCIFVVIEIPRGSRNKYEIDHHDNRVYRAYGLTGVPETFFINRQGRVVRKFSGVVTDQAVWVSTIDAVLGR